MKISFVVITTLLLFIASIIIYILYRCSIRTSLFRNDGYTTSDVFSISDKTTLQELKNKEITGLEFMRTKSIVIVSLVRDVEEQIPDIIKKVEKLASYFRDYIVLIVENDSKDNTRKELLKWSKNNSRVKILGCGVNSDKCIMGLEKTVKDTDTQYDKFRKRIEKMVYLRNIYLNEIKNKYSGFDYVCIWDLDTIGTTYIDGIANTFYYFSKENTNIDVICGFGLYVGWNPTIYYDSFAHLSVGEKYDIKNKTMMDIKYLSLSFKYKRGDEPVETDSCFGGIAFYRLSSLLSPYVFYDMTPSQENIECEHVRLHKKIKGTKLMNPSMINLVLYNES